LDIIGLINSGSEKFRLNPRYTARSEQYLSMIQAELEKVHVIKIVEESVPYNFSVGRFQS
jgi:hypothetical protein